MPKREISQIGDLTEFAQQIEKLFEERFGTKCQMGICFVIPPDNLNCHWVTNVTRESGVNMFLETARKMQAKNN